MNSAESFKWLKTLQINSGILLGTERIRAVLALFGNPQEQLRVVHVAGTNGKGSVCAMLGEIALKAGYRVGVFSSPEPISLLNTITVDHAAIEQDVFSNFCSEIRALCEKNEIILSEFEVLTVIALLHFYRERCNLAIIECGMGGANDATNVFSSPLCCVLTAVSLDHTAFLGNTLAQITENKCGIMRPGCDVVTFPGQEEIVLETLFSCAAETGAIVHLPGGKVTVRTSDLTGTIFAVNGKQYQISLPGAFQVDNSLVVLEIVQILNGKGFHFTEEAVQNGLKNAKIACRQEVISRNPLCILDGAHNVHGISALAETVRMLAKNHPVTGLFGMLKDKDCAACVSLLAPLFNKVVCCSPDNPRALPAEQLATLFEENGVYAVSSDSLESAFCKAKELAGENPLIVGGSFYISYPIRTFIK